MVWQGWPLGRAIVIAVVAILLLSTGAASGIFIETDAVAGHTAYVAAVVPLPGPQVQDPQPVSYGLATLQETYLFGLVARARALDETSGRMVFVWAAEAPDPRADPALALTGEWARVRDRAGLHWTVHEFHYAAAGTPEGFYAYGVAVGAVRHLEDGTPYNHVLTYRPDRLAAPFLDADPQGTIHHSIPLARGIGTLPDPVQGLPPAGVTWATLTRLDAA